MRFPFYIIFIFLLFSAPARAQPWVTLMMDDESNIHDVKDSFDATWQGRNYVRGQGWKQFHRWYWHMEQRTWPSGDRPDPAIYLEAMQEVGAMRSAKSGARNGPHWEPVGPTTWNSLSYNPGNGRVNTVAVDPSSPSTLYVGTPSGGLWRRVGENGTWEALFSDLPSMGVSGIAVHPTSPDTIFIATGDGDGSDTYSAGVLKSTDGGETWETTGLNWNISSSRTTRALRMNPNDPDMLYCAASNGLFVTMNGGDTWSQQLTGSFRDVEFRPGSSTIVYACSNSFFRSQNGGLSFSQDWVFGLPPASEVGRMAIAITPADSLVVYALCSREDDNGYLGLYRSTDGGYTFQLRSNSPNVMGYSMNGLESGGQAWFDMALAVDPEDPDVVYVGGINVWKSTDGGITWTIISHWVYPSDIGYTHADIHSLDILDGKLYCGSDGGVFVSEHDGASWVDLSAGLDITQFYRLGGSELVPDMILAGAQDNGSNRFVNAEWTHIHGGDGMETAVDLLDPSILYASYQFGGLIRSDDLGASWAYIADLISENGAWVTPFAIHPQMPTTILAGFDNIWFSDDRGNSWYRTTNWGDDEKVRCIAMAPSDGDITYFARNDLVQRSHDGGFTWVNIRPGLPNQSPTSIAVDPIDPMHVWITFSGSNPNNKVYESLNGGANWINRSAGLPNIPVNTIVTQPGSPNGVYIGTDMGVFYRDDYNTQWEVFGEGLPNVVVNELEVNQATGKLRAATYGRGIWEADMFTSPFLGIHAVTPLNGPSLVPLDQEGRFLIRTEENMGRILRVQLYDALGREAAASPNSTDLHNVDLSMRAKGTYIVMITTELGTWSRRAIR